MTQEEILKDLEREIALKSMINRALQVFPKAFINPNDEIILVPRYNLYFRLDNVDSELVFKCKMFEWLSRSIAKGLPTRAANNVLGSFNYLLDTRFTRKEMETIYDRLGNGVNRILCIRFIKSGYDMDLLKRD